MADLINRQVAINYIKQQRARQFVGCTIEEVMITILEELPTVEERKPGEWQITDAYPHNVYCSVCHKRFAQTQWEVWEDGSLPRKYCPECGAKME